MTIERKLADIIFLVFLFVHVATVVLWMGASILFVSVLGPSMRKLSPSSLADFIKSVLPSYMRYVVRNATVAIAAGLALYAYITVVSSSLAPSTSGMPWILIGILFGLAAYIVGIFSLTLNRRQMKMIAQASPPPTGPGISIGGMAGLQRRIRIAAGFQSLLLVLALLSMVIGANL